MKPVTDSELLRRLEEEPGQPVTDPSILAKLEGKPNAPSYLRETISNVPKSAFEYGKAITAPIHSPVQTFKGISQIAEEAQPAYHVLKALFEGKELFPGVRAIAKNYAERFGGWGNLKQTFKKDPVGTVADFATLLSGIGGVIPKVGAVGRAMEPLNVVGKVASLPLKAIPKSVPEILYKSGAKWSTTLTSKERAAITNTALSNEINLSIKGLEKLEGMIGDFRSKVSSKIDQISQPGQLGFYKFDPKDFFKDFSKLYDEALLSGRPMTNIKTLDRIKKEITTALRTYKPQGLNPDEVQKIKVKIYDDLGKYYSQAKESPMSVKGQKTVARAAKEELESLIPEIKMLNANEGALLELKDALQRASNRITNRDIIGIGTPIKGAMGAATGGVPGAAAGVALGILDLPYVKSKIATVLYRLKEKGIKVRPTPTAIRLGLFQTGRESETPADNE